MTELALLFYSCGSTQIKLLMLTHLVAVISETEGKPGDRTSRESRQILIVGDKFAENRCAHFQTADSDDERNRSGDHW
jgi:hypothetical protein